MKINVIIELPDIVDPDSVEASEAIEFITATVKQWADQFEGVTAYIDDAA